MQTFSELTVGEKFKFNGSVWTKRSARTAWLMEQNKDQWHASLIWFFFSKLERINNY